MTTTSPEQRAARIGRETDVSPDRPRRRRPAQPQATGAGVCAPAGLESGSRKRASSRLASTAVSPPPRTTSFVACMHAVNPNSSPRCRTRLDRNIPCALDDSPLPSRAAARVKSAVFLPLAESQLPAAGARVRSPDSEPGLLAAVGNARAACACSDPQPLHPTGHHHRRVNTAGAGQDYLPDPCRVRTSQVKSRSSCASRSCCSVSFPRRLRTFERHTPSFTGVGTKPLLPSAPSPDPWSTTIVST